MSYFWDGFEKAAGLRPLKELAAAASLASIGGGIGALAGGEEDEHGDRKDRGKGAIRGATAGLGAYLGAHVLGSAGASNTVARLLSRRKTLAQRLNPFHTSALEDIGNSIVGGVSGAGAGLAAGGVLGHALGKKISGTYDGERQKK